MKILVVGGTGIIGTAITSLLKEEHDVITVGRSNGDYQVDIGDRSSVKKLLEDVGQVDGIISTCGIAGFGPFQSQTDEDVEIAINTKLMGQMDLIRLGVHAVKENGFILVTTGAASYDYLPGASLITMANTGLEGYVRAINIEPHNGVRINAVSPSIVKETMELMDFEIPGAVSAADTASVYKMVMESDESGIVAKVHEYLK